MSWRSWEVWKDLLSNSTKRTTEDAFYLDVSFNWMRCQWEIHKLVFYEMSIAIECQRYELGSMAVLSHRFPVRFLSGMFAGGSPLPDLVNTRMNDHELTHQYRGFSDILAFLPKSRQMPRQWKMGLASKSWLSNAFLFHCTTSPSSSGQPLSLDTASISTICLDQGWKMESHHSVAHQ